MSEISHAIACSSYVGTGGREDGRHGLRPRLRRRADGDCGGAAAAAWARTLTSPASARCGLRTLSATSAESSKVQNRQPAACGEIAGWVHITFVTAYP